MPNKNHFDSIFAARKRIFRTALLLLLFTTLTACKLSQDAETAARELSAVSQQLSAYYTDLVQQMTDTVSLNQMQSDLLGVPFDATDRAQLDTARQELNKRAAIAKAMTKLAGAYSGLAVSKAGSDIAPAAEGLAKELVSIKAIPGGPAIPDLIGQAGSALIELVRTHKLQQSSGKVAEAVDAVHKLFQNEAQAYESINKQRVALAESLAIALVDKDMVEMKLSLTAALKPFDLAAKLPPGGVSPEVKHLAQAEIKNKGEFQITTFHETTASLSDSLGSAAKQIASVSKER